MPAAQKAGSVGAVRAVAMFVNPPVNSFCGPHGQSFFATDTGDLFGRVAACQQPVDAAQNLWAMAFESGRLVGTVGGEELGRSCFVAVGRMACLAGCFA